MNRRSYGDPYGDISKSLPKKRIIISVGNIRIVDKTDKGHGGVRGGLEVLFKKKRREGKNRKQKIIIFS